MAENGKQSKLAEWLEALRLDEESGFNLMEVDLSPYERDREVSEVGEWTVYNNNSTYARGGSRGRRGGRNGNCQRLTSTAITESESDNEKKQAVNSYQSVPRPPPACGTHDISNVKSDCTTEEVLPGKQVKLVSTYAYARTSPPMRGQRGGYTDMSRFRYDTSSDEDIAGKQVGRFRYDTSSEEDVAEDGPKEMYEVSYKEVKRKVTAKKEHVPVKQPIRNRSRRLLNTLEDDLTVIEDCSSIRVDAPPAERSHRKFDINLFKG